MAYGMSQQLPKSLAEYCTGLCIAVPSQSDDQGVAGRLVCNLRCIIRFTGIAIPIAPGGSRKDILLLLEKEETVAKSVPTTTSSAFLFTDQQQKVLAFLREGMSNKEIAARLSLSEYTVKDHLKRIMKKMNCTSRIAVVVGLASAAPDDRRAN
jgi:DNA-binding CsgD family transcriptional regulator